jgi:hypothetical protein
VKQREQSARRRPDDARRRDSAPALPALLRRLRQVTRHGMIALGVMGAPSVVGAQVLVVTVREEPAAAAVSSAIVSATNTATGLRIDALTNDAGRAAIRLSGPGDWIASVRRIGIAPARLPAVRVDNGATVAVVLTVRRARFSLPSVLVATAAVCGRAPLGANRTATLWEQVTLALQTTVLTRDDSTRVSPFRAFTYERLLDPDMTVAASQLLATGPAGARPFTAADPAVLEKHGFVRRDADGFYTFFAPDERVLLSDSFLRTHCFSTPERDANPALAELEFRPVPRRRVPDVAGVAYVDTTSGELRRLVFRYVNARRFIPTSATQSGGEVTFERLENGQWLVSDWVIRMPRLVSSWEPLGSPVVGYRESGGFVKSEAQAIADSVADVARRDAADSAARIA